MQSAARYHYNYNYEEQVSADKTEMLRQPQPQQEPKAVLIARIAALSMVVFIMAIIFCVVWEAASARALEIERAHLQTKIARLDEERRDLRASIAASGMPEHVVDVAMQSQIRFVAIDAQNAYRVGGAD